MSDWTQELVAERLQEAAMTLRRLPPVKGTGSFSVTRTYFSDYADLLPPLPKNIRSLPTPAEISRMEETLNWTVGLDSDDAKIVWMRAYKIRWKHICVKFKISRACGDERWHYALTIISGRLNGKPFPMHLSRNRVMAIALFRQERNKARNQTMFIGHDNAICLAGKNAWSI